MSTFTAHSTIVIDAAAPKVWAALTDPQLIKQYMFGSHVVSDWQEKSPIVWQGEWQGKAYEDKGVILKIVPEQLLQVTHFSPLSGVPDVPENYHTLTYELTPDGDQTTLSLSQDNNANDEERQHSQQMWDSMLAGLKQVVEK